MSTTESGYLAYSKAEGNVFNQEHVNKGAPKRKTRTWGEIETIIRQRIAQNTHMINEMIQIRDRYNGEYVIPILDDEDNPDIPDTAPKLIQEGIDHVAMRAGSIMPNISCPAIFKGNRKESGPRSREYAKTRERILHATWKENRFYELSLRRWYRHMQGYATGAIHVFPNFETGMPQIVVRDPLTTYPEIKSAEDYTPIRDCAFVYGKSAEWIRATFPESRQENGGPVGPVKGDNRELWDLVEWTDEDIVVIGILGPRYNWYSSAEPRSPLATVPSNLELRRWPNRTGRCTVVAPARVTLDRVSSQISQIIGTVDLMSHMQALEVMAAEKAIFPDKYIVGQPGQQPTILGGQWPDGRTGQPALLMDVADVGKMDTSPSPSSGDMIDRLDRTARNSLAYSPVMSGETYGSLRTGRGIDSLLGAQVDHRVQELQEIAASWLPLVNEFCLDVFRAYWPDRETAMFSALSGDYEEFTFTPSKHIETSRNTVSYTIPGADVQGTTIQLGQLQGAGLISRRTARENHPYITNPEGEEFQLVREMLLEAGLQSTLQGAVSGQLPLAHLARLEQLVEEGGEAYDIFRAMEQLDQELREQQATEAPEAPEGMVAAPETQPGLAAGPAGVTQPPPGAAPEAGGIAPSEDQQGLRQLISAVTAGAEQAQ